MIPEIGIMLGVFLIARLVPASWKRLVVLASVLSVVVSVLVVTDLTLRGIGSDGLAERVRARLGVRDPSSTPAPGDAPAVVSAPSPTPTAAVTVTRADGGSITTDGGYGRKIAGDSSLRREWISIHDESLPASLKGTPGVRTIYKSKRYGGDYYYTADFELEAHTDVRAIAVNFLTFNIWREHVETLSYEEVVDMSDSATKTFSSWWRLYDENEVAAHYASIAYVSRVLLADGRVVVADKAGVLREALKFSVQFSAADLEPLPKRTPPSGNKVSSGENQDGGGVTTRNRE